MTRCITSKRGRNKSWSLIRQPISGTNPINSGIANSWITNRIKPVPSKKLYFIEEFIKAGADYVSVHQEEVVHLHRTITQIKELGAKAGVVINPATPVSTLSEILEFVDFVLVMSVNPGFGGQKFIESTLKKIEQLAKIRKEQHLNFLIEVDGGVSVENIQKIASVGCDIFVAGSSVFGHDNISAATTELKNLIS